MRIARCKAMVTPTPVQAELLVSGTFSLQLGLVVVPSCGSLQWMMRPGKGLPVGSLSSICCKVVTISGCTLSSFSYLSLNYCITTDLIPGFTFPSVLLGLVGHSGKPVSLCIHVNVF